MSDSIELPLVTVGIPTYNRYEKLRDCIDCVLVQDYINIELIIADNTAFDSTPNWLNKTIEANNNIRYIKHETNIGSLKNHQSLLDNAKGEFFMFLHDDDIIPDNYISGLMADLLKNPEVVLIGPCCDRYLEGSFWYTYENWDSRKDDTFTRLSKLIPDAFYFHWRFEHYMYGIFRTGMGYKISSDFKSQFHMFFYFSNKGKLMNCDKVKVLKNTTNEEIEKYKIGSTYRRHFLLRLFHDNSIFSAQQSVPITIQMLNIIFKSDLIFFEKGFLAKKVIRHFKKYVINYEKSEFQIKALSVQKKLISKYKKLKFLKVF
jgi:glycosyltransferase involved in cell wall biosynthesis